MSLDVYLRADKPSPRAPSSGIFIRWNGQTREISRATWDELNPGIEPAIALGGDAEESDVVYHRNITHNLTKMADAAGIYEHLWHPEDLNATRAHHLIHPLRCGLELLQSNPDVFKEHEPSNGWGTYEGLVAFVADYLNACERYPDAKVEVCR